MLIRKTITRNDVSPEKRSSIMRAVRSRGNKSTEARLRAALIREGFRGWNVGARHLPGKPDFIFYTERLVIFVDGCFWHGCPVCYRRPKSNQEYWDAKVKGNILRDRKSDCELAEMGWKVCRIWEHEVRENLEECLWRIHVLLK